MRKTDSTQVAEKLAIHGMRELGRALLSRNVERRELRHLRRFLATLNGGLDNETGNNDKHDVVGSDCSNVKCVQR